MDALQLMAARGVRFPRIERSSELPGAAGTVLDRGKFYPIPQASDASPVRHNAPREPVVEAGRFASLFGRLRKRGR